MPLFGPLFRYELLRVSRKGSHVAQRVLLALVLLVVLFVVYFNWFPSFDLGRPFESRDAISLNQSARFAEVFVYAMVMVQFIAIVLLTPVYVGGSITEEIDRRTFEDLFATELTNREIVLGKLFARLLYVAGIILTGLPIVALSQLFGGVSMSVLVQSYAVLFASMFLLACFTIGIAIWKGNLQSTLLIVYAYAFFFSVAGCCCSTLVRSGDPAERIIFPLSSPLYLYQLFNTDPTALTWQTPAMVGVYILLGTLLALWASFDLRTTVLRERNLAVDSLEHFSDRATEANLPLKPNHDLVLVRKEDVLHLPPGVRYRIHSRERIDDENPLLWKERNTWSRFSLGALDEALVGCIIMCGVVLLSVIFFVILATLFGGSLAESTNQIVRMVGFILLLFWVVANGLKGANSVTHERDRETLTSLLMLPVERREILAAKWQAAWLRVEYIRYVYYVLLGLGLVCRGVSFIYVPIAVGLVFSLLFLATSASIWLSTVCRSGLRATFLFLVGCLLVLFGPYLLGQFGPVLARTFTDDSAIEWRIGILLESLSPWEAWRNLNLPLGDGSIPNRSMRDDFAWKVGGAALACVLSLMAGQLLWWMARRRFEREGKD